MRQKKPNTLRDTQLVFHCQFILLIIAKFIADDTFLQDFCIIILYKNTPIQIYRKFHIQKLKIFR